MAVYAVSLIFSEGSRAGGGREVAALEEGIVSLKGGSNRDNLCIIMFL